MSSFVHSLSLCLVASISGDTNLNMRLRLKNCLYKHKDLSSDPRTQVMWMQKYNLCEPLVSVHCGSPSPED